ncbi:cadmium metallothionein-like [Hyposmocoma kahamanoa]|uniref:cadmium metallothionein-like n=1 Tax=Hyposmocoma kahamanoa TaxID=1477025 RepID=UPI000E6D5B51|nr:cadmium metallothionein-like [Hyposmocoma kahamanoa]
MLHFLAILIPAFSGIVFDSGDARIPPTTPCCPPNEVYSCDPICPPDTCCALDEEYDCCNATSPPYKTGCRCKDGYYRLYENGPCVPACDCTKAPYSCPPNEVYSCDPICPPDTCCALDDDYDCCDATSPPYKTGCRCKKGYYRLHENGPCVPAKECCNAPYSCPKNEIYSCEPICPPDTCCSIGKKYDCCDADSPPYSTGCRCKKGYYRLYDGGPCVPACDCPKPHHPIKTPKKEPYSYASAASAASASAYGSGCGTASASASASAYASG